LGNNSIYCNSCGRWSYIPDEVYNFNGSPWLFQIARKMKCCYGSESRLTWGTVILHPPSILKFHVILSSDKIILDPRKYMNISSILAIPEGYAIRIPRFIEDLVIHNPYLNTIWKQRVI
jgi:hypothetical protein